jgi:hypothetical protein
MKFCSYCNSANQLSNKFCHECGRALKTTADQSTEKPIIEAKKKEPNPGSTPLAPAPNFTELDCINVQSSIEAASESLLSNFATRLALTIWWKSLIALTILGGFMVLAAIEVESRSAANFVLILAVLFYLVSAGYIPYQTLKSMLSTSGFKTDRGEIVRIKIGSQIRNPYVALTWGFLWRSGIVTTIAALTLQSSGYSPGDLEQFLVSVLLMLLIYLLAAHWLVKAPLGHNRVLCILPNQDSEQIANSDPVADPKGK